jgi:hypothetical protein
LSFVKIDQIIFCFFEARERALAIGAFPISRYR